MQSDGLNSALSPVVYGYIVLSINTQYKHIQNKSKCKKDINSYNILLATKNIGRDNKGQNH